MNVYTSDILSAAFTFPLIAAVITLPYLIHQYRKFGSVPWLRTFAVYSFVFYLMCAYFLVLLPLPADRTAFVPYAATPQLVPFNFVREIVQGSHVTASPSTWLGFIRTPAVYEAFFNLLLTVPFGMYLRYFFRRSWKQALILGFCLTLSFETLQFTGLLGLYAHPYRLFDVDDLIVNTLGAMVGFWVMGPVMRMLPDMRLINAEAREAGIRASATRRALSFGVDVLATLIAAAVLALVFAAVAGLVSQTGGAGTAEAAGAAGGAGGAAFDFGTLLDPSKWTLGLIEVGEWAVLAALFFVVIPTITRGQTLGQKLLRLRTVRPDASQAHWYQYAARYGALFVVALAPLVVIFGWTSLPAGSARSTESGAVASFITTHQETLLWIWAALMGIWVVTLIVRAARSAALKRPFVMLNGLLSNTRVMTCAGVQRELERRQVMSVEEVAALEQRLVEEGTSLAELMDRAGKAVAREVCTWVPEPSPVVILAGSGNNGGDGWGAARELARTGYHVTLVTPDLAERLHAEPARTTAASVFSAASTEHLPLHVLVAPDIDVLADAIDNAKAVVDAMLGTGFVGDDVREPYASWIEAANRRRFEGSRGHGRGRHRKRVLEQGNHARKPQGTMPHKAKDAPFAVAVDVPSGLSAATGQTAHPCFAADMTVTMLAFKPGLVTADAPRHTGTVQLAKLTS